MNKELQIIIASGTDDAHRAVLGFSAAASAAISSTKVYVFLTMHGVSWADENIGNDVIVPGFSSISEYIEILQENNVFLEVCSTCIGDMCVTSDNDNKLRKGFKPSGLVTMVSRMSNCETVTF